MPRSHTLLKEEGNTPGERLQTICRVSGLYREKTHEIHVPTKAIKMAVGSTVNELPKEDAVRESQNENKSPHAVGENSAYVRAPDINHRILLGGQEFPRVEFPGQNTAYAGGGQTFLDTIVSS